MDKSGVTPHQRLERCLILMRGEFLKQLPVVHVCDGFIVVSPPPAEKGHPIRVVEYKPAHHATQHIGQRAQRNRGTTSWY
jgi:hypothetical protein